MGMRQTSGQRDPDEFEDDIEIRPFGPPDMDAVCELIGLAFAENPSTLANVRGDRVKARRTMQDAVRVAKFGRPWSHALVAVNGSTVVGAINASAWPHCQMGIAEKIKTAPSMLRIMKTALPRAFTMMARREAHDPHRPHWHIGPIGVRPDVQNRGVGKALLERFLATVDAEGSPAFLETDVDRNVGFYEKFGFQTIDHEDIVGVDTRFLWRNPGQTITRLD
jgi:ribosomal protein S18 acetylase RimI-like enzyme